MKVLALNVKVLSLFALLSVAAFSKAGLLSTVPGKYDPSTLGSFAEGRGRVATNSWRQSLFGSDGPAAGSPNQLTGSNWTSKSFTLSYTAATKTFSWTMPGTGFGTITRSLDVIDAGEEFVGFRFDVKSTKDAGKNANFVGLSGLTYTAGGVASNLTDVSSSGGNTVGSGYFFDKKVGDFTITGLATFTKAATNASGTNDDRDTFSFRALSAAPKAAPVPEPGTMLVLGLGAVAALKRRRSAK
jgi:PEP-CTERM motif